MSVRSSALPSLLLLALVAPVLVAQEGPRPMLPPPPMIEASGTGEVKTLPDRAQVLVSVAVRAQTAAAAGSDNATRTQKVLEALRAAGIPREQLSTVGYTVQPNYNYPGQGRSPVLTGYDARNTVRVELRQVEQVGKAIDVALAAGANDIQGVNFYIANPTAVRRDVLAAATSDARAVAEAIARAAGGVLGALLSVSTENDGVSQMDFSGKGVAGVAMAAERAPTPIYAPTEQSVTGRVVARWVFVPNAR